MSTALPVRAFGALLALLVLSLAPAAAAAKTALVLRGGAIYTLDPHRPWASALVISAGRIVYVGDDAGALAHAGAKPEVIALNGRMVLPGFHDAHAHPMSGGLRFLRCDLAGLRSEERIDAAVRACAASKVRGGWLVGYNWSPGNLRSPVAWREKLDALVPDAAAYFATDDGYTAWVNARALAAANIDPNGASQDIDGLARDARTRKPTGVVTGEALERIHRQLPQPTEAEYREALKRWTQLANRFGITSLFDAFATAPMLEAYHAADLAGELRLRIVAAQAVDPRQGVEQVDRMAAERHRLRGPYFRADAAKIFLDGEIGMHTAALLAPYADTPASRGEMFISPDRLDPLVRRLDAAGFLIHMHAMGDRAVRTGLDSIARAIAANGSRDRRHQIAHVGMADPADIPRFGRLGVSANLQPMWFQADDPAMASTEAVLGPARARLIYPAASIAAHGGRLVLSSDWPATSANPLDGIQAAVTRQPLDGGKPAKRPEERIDLATALAGYTRNAAWVVREDGVDGAIEVGKAADLVVLDRNLFRTATGALHKARVLLTLLDGRPAYRDPHFH